MSVVEPIKWVVYSTSNNDYQEWQCQLLDFSFRRAGQSGRLVRLCCEDVIGRPFGKSSIAEVIQMPDFAKIHGRNYKAINRPLALNQWIHADKRIGDHDVILSLDPDMVFLRRTDNPGASRGTLVGQRWLNGNHSSSGMWSIAPNDVIKQLNAESCFMHPVCFTAADYKKMGGAYVRYTDAVLDAYPNAWMSEMYGNVMAALDVGIQCRTIERFGTCNDWAHLQTQPLAPIAHYCQPIRDVGKNQIWFKNAYTASTRSTPWKLPCDPDLATNDQERELLQLIHTFIRNGSNDRSDGDRVVDHVNNNQRVLEYLAWRRDVHSRPSPFVGNNHVN